jgi:HK97 family phage portal protein
LNGAGRASGPDQPRQLVQPHRPRGARPGRSVDADSAALVTPCSSKSGRIAYNVKDPTSNIVTTYTQDQIFHVRGVSDDGVEGKSLLTWARDSIGIALATESYAGRLFSQGSLHSGVISVPACSIRKPRSAWRSRLSRRKRTWHMPKVLEQGATYTESTLTPEDSQFLTSRQFSVTEMSRWFGIPPHKLFDLSRSTNNNIEHQGIEYVGDGLMPWLVLIEQAILRDLILNPARFYAEFNVEGMLRGDSAARGELYKSALWRRRGVTE